MIKRNSPEKKRKNSMRKEGSGILTKRMSIPGMDLFKTLIPGNTPLTEGVYMVYYDPNPPHADSNVKKVAGVGIANYSDGKWGLNYKVKAYLGPIPGLNLESLNDYTPPYLINQIFYIATLEQASKKLYASGPYAIHMLAFLTLANPDNFIFCLDTENVEPYPVSKFVRRKDGHCSWKTLSEKAIKKYQKRMKMLGAK